MLTPPFVAFRGRLDPLTFRLEASAYGAERMAWRSSERDKLEQELGVIEEKIAAASELIAQTIRERDLSLADVSACLRPGTVWVDFVQYQRHDFAAKTNQWKEARYAVYLTFPPSKDFTNIVVERVDLGEAVLINEAVERIGKLMAAGQIAPKRLQPVLQRLSGLVYAPLAKHLTNVSHLIVCPDGQLSPVPFEMLLHEGKYLVETKTISYVTSGREFVRLASGQASPKFKESKVQSSKSLVTGDPDFDLDLAGSSRRSPGRSPTKSGEEAHSEKSEGRNPKPETDQSLLTSAPTKYRSRSARGLKFTPFPAQRRRHGPWPI